jgi:cytochrome c oxidase subunit 4
MAEHTPSPRTYLIVLAILLALTALTIGVSFLHVNGLWHVVIGLIIAAVKASLVVLFFMHAVTSPRVTWVVILIAIAWIGILLVLTLADYFTRGLVPYTPGH